MSDDSTTLKSRRLIVSLFAIGLVVTIIKEVVDNLQHVLLSGCDPAWLIKTGQIIIATHTVPKADSFSWTSTGNQLVCYQWLFEVAQAYLFNTGGLWLVGLASLLCFGTLYLFLLPMTWLRSGVRPIWILLCLALVFSPYWVMARPQTLSHLFIFAFVLLLERFVSTRKVLYLFALPPLIVLWNNIHLTAILGIMVLVAYLLEAVFSTFVRTKSAGSDSRENTEQNADSPPIEYLSALGSSPRLCLTLAGMTILCAVCLCMNPYGLDLIPYQLTYPTRMSAADIAELKGLNILDAIFRLIHLAIVWIALVAVSVKRGLPSRWLILAATATFAFFVVTRLQPLVVLLTWLPVGAALSMFNSTRLARTDDSRASFKDFSKPEKLAVAAVMAIGSFALPAMLWNWKYPSESVIRSAFLGDKSLTLNYYAAHCAANAHPFNDSDTGDRLIFLGAGPVFIDSRFDFYGREFFRNWFECIESYGNWQIRIERWKPTHLLVKDTYKLYWKLMSSPDWCHVVDDGYLSLWMPKNEATESWLQTEKLDTAQLKGASLEPQLLASTVTGRACKHLQLGKFLLEGKKFEEAIAEISEACKLVPSQKLLRELNDAKRLSQQVQTVEDSSKKKED